MDFDKLSISERKIIVGIDFGTTYSGVAWAETQRPDRRVAVTVWPISKTTREGESSDKVPTKLWYANGNDNPDWGFSIPMNAPSDEVVEWFKLLVLTTCAASITVCMLTRPVTLTPLCNPWEPQ